MISFRVIHIATALLTAMLAMLGVSRSIFLLPAEAMPLVPATDGSETSVSRDGDRHDISGGQLSAQGDNLFHSFSEFNLPEGEIANFISSPSIRNILTRVKAGNPSIINGTLQITGGNANLFLLNPAGIIFGSTARLQLPGSFVATTARGVGFDGGLFDVWSENNYQALVGEPNSFLFNMEFPGSIVNAGSLAVSSGENLTLIGGTVINTGNLSAPEGNISINVVPGKSKVLIGQEGMVLNLEIEPIAEAGGEFNGEINPLDLPQLLTEGFVKTGHAIAAAVNDDGTIFLTGSTVGIPTEPGMAIVSGNLETTSESLGGSIDIFANKIAVTDANIDASGSFGGGKIRIGGDIEGRGAIPNAQRVFVSSDSVISADALVNGNGGKVVVWADEINYFSGTITARGNQEIGEFSLDSAPEMISNGSAFNSSLSNEGASNGSLSNGGFVEISSQGSLIFEGTVNLSASNDNLSNDNLGTLLLDPENIKIKNGSGTGTDDTTLPDVLQAEQPGSVFIIYEETLESLAQDANLILEATNDITIENLSDNTLEFAAGDGAIAFRADADRSGQGNFLMNPEDEILAPGRDINILGDRIAVSRIDTSAPDNGGNIKLISLGGNIIVGHLNTTSANGNGGDIDLDAGSGLVDIRGTVKTRNLTVTGDAINFGSVDSIQGTGKLLVQPGTIDQNIELGGSGITSGLDLNETELQAIADGFESIEIGISEGTGIVTLKDGASFNAPVIIAGGSTLVGPNRNSTWKITGIGSGSIEEYPNGLTFENIENLTGGNKDDTFVFSDNAAIDGTIDGGLGNDTLDYSAYQSEVFVDIDTNQATGTQGILNIEKFIPNNPVNLGANNANSSDSGGANANNSSNSGTNNANNSGNANSGNANSGNSSSGSGNNANNSGNNSGNSGNSGTNNANNSGNNAGNSGNNAGNSGTSQPASSVTPLTISPPTPITPGGALPDTFDTPEATQSGNSTNSQSASPEPASTESGIIPPTPENPELPSFDNPAETSAILAASGLDSSPASPPENSSITPSPAIAPNNQTLNNQTLNNPARVQAIAPNNQTLNNPVPIPALAPNNQNPNNQNPNNQTLNNPAPIPALAPNNQNPNNQTLNNPAPIPALPPNNQNLNNQNPNNQNPNNPAPIPALPLNNQTPIPAIAPNNSIEIAETTEAIDPLTNLSVNRENNASNPVDFLYRSAEDRSISGVGSSDRLSSELFRGNQQILSLNTRLDIERFLDEENLALAVQKIDFFFSKDFEDYLRQQYNNPYPTFIQIQDKLGEMAESTPAKAAIMYIFTRPKQLDLVLVPPGGEPIHKSVPAAHRAALLEQVQAFKRQITDPTRRRTTSYLPSSQKLYNWFVAPLEQELEELGIDTLIFSMDRGLRTLPLAALHDGQEFLIQKYNISLTPSLHLTDARYADIKNVSVLAMGVSEFEDKNPLPAVPVEIATIAEGWYKGQAFLNQEFTLDNLKQQRENEPFGIIHLATHGQFKSGQEENSYLQLWDGKLHLERMRELKWNEPTVELLVLSACRTAVGDAEAEYGFAGLAVQAGVKSALASLWYANDAGTLSLMSELYNQLRSVPIKAEALRKAQTAMIEENVRLENGELIGTFGNIPLPAELAELGDRSLSHPYYWAGFTMIGSPW